MSAACRMLYLDHDTDGDWLDDFEEVHGNWRYNGEAPGSACSGPMAGRVRNARVVHTDGDGLRAAERVTRAGGSRASAVACTAM